MSWFHRKRRVRVHMVPLAGVDDVDFEGILTGMLDGHYVLAAARLRQGAERSFGIDNVIEIPAGRVWWIERLTAVAT